MVKLNDSNSVAVSARKVRARNLRIMRAFSLVVCLCIAFVAGFAIRSDGALLESLGFSAISEGASSSLNASITKEKKDSYSSLSARVLEVEDIVEKDSLDYYDLDATTTNVFNAFAASTEDKYFRYYDPARYAALMREGSGNYTGVGVLFSEYNGSAYAVDVFEGSVAQVAGVRQGDFVVAIDGDRKHGWSTNEVTSAVDRNQGDTVVITWRRPASLEAEGGEEFTTTLSCSKYDVKNVTGTLSDTVGSIVVKQLTQNSSNLVKQTVVDLTAQGATSFVLDIRDNPGGYLTQAVDIASLFVKSGTLVQIETKDGKNTKLATGSVATEKPLVVLVNGNTAAAAEVLAAALQENQRAILVGTTTLGKGSVQVVRDLTFGGALRYTAAYYLTPQGRAIDDVGVTPNVTVDRGSDAGSDNQMNLALETAQSLVRE